MPDYQALLTQLEEILHWKKSKKFYADKLGIAESDVDELLKELRTRESIIQEAELADIKSEESLSSIDNESINSSDVSYQTLKRKN